MNTPKLVIVTGTPCSGKTTFIERNYGDGSKYEVLDLAKESILLTGGFEALHDDRLYDLFIESCGKAMEGLMYGKNLVIEFCFGSDADQGLTKAVKKARDLGMEVNMVCLTIESKEARKRHLSALGSPSYYPSLRLREETLEVLEGILESYEMTKCLGLIPATN